MTPRDLVTTLLPPLLLAALFTACACVATGATTGCFFGGVVVATLLTPPLVLAETTRSRQLMCAAAVVDGIGIAWLFAVAHPSISIVDWLQSYVVLIAFTFALTGLALLLCRRLRFSVFPASALVVALSLAWLSFPVWLSPHLAGRPRLVGALTVAHPLLTLDGVFRALGAPWTERHFMYNYLSVLNQDVPYELPRTILPAVLLHGLIGCAALLLARRPVRLEVDLPGRGGSGAGEQRVGEDLLP